MKKLLFALLVAVLCVALAVPAMATWRHVTISVYRDKGYSVGPYGHELITSGVQYFVLDGGDFDETADIYSDKGLTSMTNPVTATVFETKDRIDFYYDDATYTSDVDVIVVDNAGGYTLFMDGINENVHSCVINERPNEMHHGLIWWNTSCTSTDIKDYTNTGHNGGYDTGIDVAVGTVIHPKVIYNVLSESHDSESGNVIVTFGLGAANAGLAFGQQADKLTGYSNTGIYGYASNAESMMALGHLFLNAYDCGATEITTMYWPVDYFVWSTASLTYSLWSGDDNETGVGEDPFRDMGWGFIHWFFTPAMPGSDALQ